MTGRKDRSFKRPVPVATGWPDPSVEALVASFVVQDDPLDQKGSVAARHVNHKSDATSFLTKRRLPACAAQRVAAIPCCHSDALKRRPKPADQSGLCSPPQRPIETDQPRRYDMYTSAHPPSRRSL